MPREIVLVIYSWFPNHQYLFDLIQENLDYSLRYFVLSSQDRNQPREFPVNPVKLPSALFNGVKARVLPTVIPGFSLNLFSREVRFNFNFQKYLLKTNPALVITKGWGDPGYFTAKNFAKNKNVPLITWMCGRDPRVYRSFSERMIRRASNFLAREILKESRFVFVYGQKAKEDAIKLGVKEEKIIITKFSTSEENFNYRNYFLTPEGKISFRRKLGLNENPLFLCISQLIPRKGIEDLLEVFPRMEKKYSAQLLLIGAGQSNKRIKEYAKNHHRYFRWLPSVSYKETPYYYLNSDYFVFPTHFDAWGVVINEAHCTRLPIICSDGAQASYDLIKQRESGLIYKAGDRNALLGCMEYALDHPSDMKRMAENGYNFIQKEWNTKESAKIWTEYIKIAIEETE